MMNWLIRQRRLDLLERRLRESAERPVKITKTRKKEMKRRVLCRIDNLMAEESVSFHELSEQLEKLNLTVAPTRRFKTHTRDNLLDMLSLKVQRLGVFDLFKDLFAQRRVWATVVACMVLSVGTMGYLTQLPQVSAAKVNTVDSFRGTVELERAGAPVFVESGLLLEEGDVITTGGDGWVDVMFSDDSWVTVGPDSSVILAQMWTNPYNEANSAIEVEVEQGRVWANVVNLMPNDSSFVLSSDEAHFLVDRKATFDLFVSDDQTELRVFSHLVDFEVAQDGVMQTGTLGPNLMMTVMDEDLSVELIEDMHALSETDVWVQTNLEGSEKYLERLGYYYSERVTQRAGSLPGELMYPVKRMSESIRLWTSFMGDSKSSVILDLAERRFSEATVLAAQGDYEAAEEALLDYQALILTLAEDDEDAQEEIQAVIEESKKILDGGLPVEDFYDFREWVGETEFLVAEDEASRGAVQLETAADRLGLAFELIQIGAYDLAVQALQDYDQGLTDVLDSLPDMDIENRKEIVLLMLDQKIRDLQMLKLISAELLALTNGEFEEGSEILVQVDALHNDTLYQLNSLVLSLKERAVIHLGTFLEDVKDDETIQQEVLDRLKKDVELDFEYMQLINDVEALYGDESPDVVVVEDSFVTLKGSDEVTLEMYFDEQIEAEPFVDDLEVELNSASDKTED